MTATDGSAALVVRRATHQDDPQVLTLLRESLGKSPDDPYERFFTWKHRANPFGESPAWVAEDDGQVVGYRTFLRWEFLGPNERTIRAVRAVDTATHPSYRGRGIFRTLTLAAVQELRDEGVDLVFNTPNDQSQPGYLSMGWRSVRRLPVALRPHGLSGGAKAFQAARRHDAAELWSGADVPDRADEVLARPGLPALLASLPRPRVAVTPHSPAYLLWRYGLPELGYRAFMVGEGLADGLLVGRVRRRGPALELAVCEVLIPQRRRAAGALRGALRRTGADYAIGLGSTRVRGMLPVPEQGPLLTFLPLSAPSHPPEDLGLGDVELF